MGKAKIIFTNGMEIEAEENAGSLLTASRPEFPMDLSTVTVVGASGERAYKNAKIRERASADGRYCFEFSDGPRPDWNAYFAIDRSYEFVYGSRIAIDLRTAPHVFSNPLRMQR